MSDTQSDPQNLKMKHLLECFYILGIIESKGLYLDREKNLPKLTYNNIAKLLDILFQETRQSTPDYTRRIKTARNIFNELSKDFAVKGDVRGIGFEKKISALSSAVLKHDKAYTTLLVMFLSLLYHKETVHIDFTKQLLEQEFPIHFLTVIHNAIRNRLPIHFLYTNRKQETHEVEDFVPVKIRFKDGHWILVGWNEEKKAWNQYMIHSMQVLHVSFGKPKTNTPKFNMEDYLKHSFGHAVLNDSEVHKIEIKVPFQNVEAVQKRNGEGKWERKEEHYVWTVYAYDPDEVINYVFRWNGCLEIISPESIRQRFLERLKNLLKMYE